MNASTSIPTTLELRPSRLVALMVGTAALAAIITWALLVFAVNTTSDVLPQSNATGTQLTGIPASAALSPTERAYVQTVNKYLQEGKVLYGPVYGAG